MATQNHEWLIDVPVAINFFARPDEFEQAFEVVRRARPRQLFLISDGPRPDVPGDVENVRKCREIASCVDWECEAYHYYNKENKGLFNTYFESMAKVFEIVDRCIFLEDDLVVSDSFFEFCRVLLDRYENDLRVHFITGMNYLGKYDDPSSDYFFTGEGSIIGYALWRRTFESMEFGFIEDPYVVRCTKDVARQIKPGYEKRIDKTVKDIMWEGHLPHVEFHKNVLRMTQNQVYIVPTKNMVCNIGLSANSAHTAGSLSEVPRAMRKLYFQKTYEYNFPLKHPRYVVRDLSYEKIVNNQLAWNKPILRWMRRIEALFLHIRAGDFSRIAKKIKGGWRE